MTYGLSFAPRFYYPEAKATSESMQPTSVYEAVRKMRTDTWEQLASDIFGCDPAHLSIETVMGAIRETDTCSNLTTPVEVWIDLEGDFTVEVFDD